MFRLNVDNVHMIMLSHQAQSSIVKETMIMETSSLVRPLTAVILTHNHSPLITVAKGVVVVGELVTVEGIIRPIETGVIIDLHIMRGGVVRLMMGGSLLGKFHQDLTMDPLYVTIREILLVYLEVLMRETGLVNYRLCLILDKGQVSGDLLRGIVRL